MDVQTTCVKQSWNDIKVSTFVFSIIHFFVKLLFSIIHFLLNYSFPLLGVPHLHKITHLGVDQDKYMSNINKNIA